MRYLKFFLPVAAFIICIQYIYAQSQVRSIDYDHSKNPYYSHTNNTKLNVSDAQWKKILPSTVYWIAREKGTERSFTGKYWDNHTKGMYYCAVCGHPLYSSENKYDSHTGWPSFFQPLNSNSVLLQTDPDGERTEVLCPRCGSHLGHVFDDGPPPTNKRYCMDGDVLDFVSSK